MVCHLSTDYQSRFKGYNDCMKGKRTVLPVSIDADWLNVLRIFSPRTNLRNLSSMVKLVANILAVILRQSVQLQTNTPTRPGPSVGCDGERGCQRRAQGGPTSQSHE